jgi:hypothetical protein
LKASEQQHSKKYSTQHTTQHSTQKFLTGNDELIANYIVGMLEGNEVEATITDLLQRWHGEIPAQKWLYAVPGRV